MKIKIEKNNVGERLDVFLSSKIELSRSTIGKHIKKGQIIVNDQLVKCGYLLKEDDEINIGDLKTEINVVGEEIPLDIFFEDDYLLVVNKPSGMVVHPAPGNYSHTLVNALVGYTYLSDINGEFRPGVVHRIDKDTSGLLVVAKNNNVHEELSKMFKDKTIKKKYIALVSGVINENSGKIDAPIGRSINDRKKMSIREDGKKAVTYFTVLERYKDSTLIEVIIETGRTHQIRVHMSYIKHSIINDPVYRKKIYDDYGQMLHAGYLGFIHPVTKEFLEFNAPLEKRFLEILDDFKNS